MGSSKPSNYNDLLPVLAGEISASEIIGGEDRLKNFIMAIEKFARYNRPEWQDAEIQDICQGAFMATMVLAQNGLVEASLLQAAKWRVMDQLKKHKKPGQYGAQEKLTDEEKTANAIKEKLRRRRIAVGLHESNHDDAVVQKVDADLYKPELQKVLKRLKPDEQEIVSMRAEGFENKEIAIILDRPESTVSKRYNRAIKKIKQFLTPAIIEYNKN